MVVGSFGDAPPSSRPLESESTTPFALEAEVVRVAETRWGRLDGLVINHATLAPVGRVAAESDAKVEGWQEAFNVNFFSAVALVS